MMSWLRYVISFGVELIIIREQQTEIFPFQYFPGNSMFDRDPQFEYGAVIIMANHNPVPNSIRGELRVNPEAIVEVFEAPNLRAWRPGTITDAMAYYILKENDSETRIRVLRELQLIRSQRRPE